MEVQTLMNEGIVRHLCKTHYPDEYGIAGQRLGVPHYLFERRLIVAPHDQSQDGTADWAFE